MTDQVLQSLEILPPLEPLSGQTSLLQLPTEVMASITEAMRPFSDPPLECSFLLPPSYWLDALLHGSLLPWLWDLNEQAIMRKEKSKTAGREWNWELLVRHLAQCDTQEPRPAFWAKVDPSFGLKNRKRIWDLVNEVLHEQSPPDPVYPWQTWKMAKYDRQTT